MAAPAAWAKVAEASAQARYGKLPEPRPPQIAPPVTMEQLQRVCPPRPMPTIPQLAALTGHRVDRAA
jgi:hypothetical protein